MPSAAPADAPPLAVSAASTSSPTIVIPALTPVRLMLKQSVGSKISTGGEPFAFVLAEPLIVDGREIVPAGTPGMGEVVHAKKGGGSGAGGELVLAARYLQVGDRQLRLRSMRVAVVGKDSISTVDTMVAVPVVGMFGFLVKGKEVDIPEGTVVSAKTAEDFSLPAGVARQQASSSSNEGDKQ